MADPVKFRETIRKRGRTISPEIIQQILESLGPGAIKRVFGVTSKIRLGGRDITQKTSGGVDLEAKALSEQLTKSRRGNLNSPVSLGTGLRRNIGGKRPPDTELEALALRKQQAAMSKRINKEISRDELRRRTRDLDKAPDMFKRLQEVNRKIDALFSRQRPWVRARDNPAYDKLARERVEIVRDLNASSKPSKPKDK